MRQARAVWVVGLMVAVGAAGSPAAAQQADISAGPTFTPYTVRPELRSEGETRALLDALYPSRLREAGIGGTAIVWLYIDRTGAVGRAELFRSSGFEALDAAALRAAEEMEFTPARNRDRPVDVWVQVPVTFGGEAGARRAERRVGRAPSGAPADITAAPTFTPYTEAPAVANQAVVTEALRAAYPPLLRNAGIGGTSHVWFLIDEAGAVVNTRLARSSGHEALDEAALRVASAMEFHPARNRGEDVMVWVQIPVTFTSR